MPSDVKEEAQKIGHKVLESQDISNNLPSELQNEANDLVLKVKELSPNEKKLLDLVLTESYDSKAKEDITVTMEDLNKISKQEWEEIYTKNAKAEAEKKGKPTQENKHKVSSLVEKISKFINKCAETIKKPPKAVYKWFKEQVTKQQTKEQSAQKDQRKSTGHSK